MSKLMPIGTFLVNPDQIIHVEILRRSGRDDGHVFSFEFVGGKNLAFGPLAPGLKEAIRYLGIVDFEPEKDKFHPTSAMWRMITPEAETKVFEM